VIDLRSDTATRPTPEMRTAIAAAVVGDEQRREDPTVLELERRGAELLGHEEAVFLPTATMANQIALRLLSEPGYELIAEENSHVLLYEEGGPAVHSGLVTRGLPGHRGRITVDQVRRSLRGPSVVSLENTHNSSGGRVWPRQELDDVVAVCRELGLPVHLDGARLLNAAVASGETPAALARGFDTVTVCFSKGLGCPLGALVAGSAARMADARRGKFLFGGAMRQAGIVAAAALHALDHHVDRLAEDHARARRLAEGLVAAGLAVNLDQVETNFVQIDVGPLGFPRDEALQRLRDEGVGLSSTIHPTVIRAVTHLDVSDDDVARAIDAIPRALGVARGAAIQDVRA
jgi:threonine aldolase